MAAFNNDNNEVKQCSTEPSGLGQKHSHFPFMTVGICDFCNYISVALIYYTGIQTKSNTTPTAH